MISSLSKRCNKVKMYAWKSDNPLCANCLWLTYPDMSLLSQSEAVKTGALRIKISHSAEHGLAPTGGKLLKSYWYKDNNKDYTVKKKKLVTVSQAGLLIVSPSSGASGQHHSAVDLNPWWVTVSFGWCIRNIMKSRKRFEKYTTYKLSQSQLHFPWYLTRAENATDSDWNVKNDASCPRVSCTTTSCEAAPTWLMHCHGNHALYLSMMLSCPNGTHLQQSAVSHFV